MDNPVKIKLDHFPWLLLIYYPSKLLGNSTRVRHKRNAK